MPVEEIQRGIKHGVRKINIDTDNRMAMTGQIRKVLTENPGEFDPRKYLKPAMEAMTKLCKQRLQEFNTAGQASKIKRVFTLGRDGQALRLGRARPDLRRRPHRRPSNADRAFASIIDRSGASQDGPVFVMGTLSSSHLVTWIHGRTAARLYLITPVLDDACLRAPARRGLRDRRVSRPCCCGWRRPTSAA